MQVWLGYLTEHRWIGAAAVLLGSFLVAWAAEAVLLGVLSRLASRTKTRLDDQIIALLRRPIHLSVLLLGLHWSLALINPSAAVQRITGAVLQTFAIVVWSISSLRIGTLFLRHLASVAKSSSLVQARTQPIFDIFLKTAVLGSAAYLFLVAWGIDIGAWIASAGIVGIAVGFAARDSLANYFAGVFIIADAPYKLGDVIVLDDGTRGRVTDIGLRSTRILTRDDIEINIPNSILGNMKVMNASAGPTPQERIAIDVSVAYGSNVEQVIDLLRGIVAGTPHVAKDREPEVLFKKMADSALELCLLVWVEDPGAHETVKHALTLRAYNALNGANIEIPYPKTDIYVRELPSRAASEPLAVVPPPERASA